MRKFHDSAYEIAGTPAGLVEVVDGDNRPLCVMSVAEVRSQKLLHRGIALLMRDRERRFMTVQDAEGQPGFTLFAPCMAGLAYADSCDELVTRHWGGLPAFANLLKVWPPCSENFGSFTGICEIVLSEAMLENLSSSTEGSLIVDYSGLAALLKSSCGLAPFLALILESGFLRK